MLTHWRRSIFMKLYHNLINRSVELLVSPSFNFSISIYKNFPEITSDAWKLDQPIISAFIFFSRLSTPGPSADNSFTSMYEKTFPIRVVQNSSPCSSSRNWRGRTHCTAQEVWFYFIFSLMKVINLFVINLIVCFLLFCSVQSVREEEKEVYRQLLAVVSGGQSSFLLNSSSHTGLRSHRDLWVLSFSVHCLA